MESKTETHSNIKLKIEQSMHESEELSNELNKLEIDYNQLSIDLELNEKFLGIF